MQRPSLVKESRKKIPNQKISQQTLQKNLTLRWIPVYLKLSWLSVFTTSALSNFIFLKLLRTFVQNILIQLHFISWTFVQTLNIGWPCCISHKQSTFVSISLFCFTIVYYTIKRVIKCLSYLCLSLQNRFN